MSKNNHEYRHSLKQIKRSLVAQWERVNRARVRQTITFATALFILSALLSASTGDALARPLFATAPPLGTLENFAVLGATTVTNTGPTVITGDVGVSPGSAIVGFPPGVVVSGTIHSNDAVAIQAQADATVAYDDLTAQVCDDTIPAELGGTTLMPGVYCFDTSAQLTSILTLDAQGDPTAVFVFKIPTSLTTGSASSVNLINGAAACNIFWQVGSSATLGTSTAFQGNILALISATATTSATVSGRVIARTGALTLDTNIVSVCQTPLPELELTKEATQANYDAVGDVIDYTLVATNTGNITLTDVTISDPLLPTLTCAPAQPAVLLPDTTLSCTGSYVVTQADIYAGQVTNTATADSVETAPVQDSDSVIAILAPALALSKQATQANYDAVGDVITYTLVASNTGNITLTDVIISDPMLPTLTCAPAQPADLEPDETLSCTGSYTVTQSDLDAGQVNNTASADSVETAPVQGSESVPAIQSLGISVGKTGSAGPIPIGGTILYTITVLNTSNVTLNNVTVTDAKLGMTETVGTLTVGQSTVVTGTYGPLIAADQPGPVVNVASVTATTPLSVPVGPVTATHSVAIGDPTNEEETEQPKGNLYIYLPTVQVKEAASPANRGRLNTD